jgi:hypothetical protein
MNLKNVCSVTLKLGIIVIISALSYVAGLNDLYKPEEHIERTISPIGLIPFPFELNEEVTLPIEALPGCTYFTIAGGDVPMCKYA